MRHDVDISVNPVIITVIREKLQQLIMSLSRHGQVVTADAMEKDIQKYAVAGVFPNLANQFFARNVERCDEVTGVVRHAFIATFDSHKHRGDNVDVILAAGQLISTRDRKGAFISAVDSVQYRIGDSNFATQLINAAVIEVEMRRNPVTIGQGSAAAMVNSMVAQFMARGGNGAPIGESFVHRRMTERQIERGPDLVFIQRRNSVVQLAVQCVIIGLN